MGFGDKLVGDVKVESEGSIPEQEPEFPKYPAIIGYDVSRAEESYKKSKTEPSGRIETDNDQEVLESLLLAKSTQALGDVPAFPERYERTGKIDGNIALEMVQKNVENYALLSKSLREGMAPVIGVICSSPKDREFIETIDAMDVRFRDYAILSNEYPKMQSVKAVVAMNAMEAALISGEVKGDFKIIETIYHVANNPGSISDVRVISSDKIANHRSVKSAFRKAWAAWKEGYDKERYNEERENAFSLALSSRKGPAGERAGVSLNQSTFRWVYEALKEDYGTVAK